MTYAGFSEVDVGVKIAPRFFSYTTLWGFREIQFLFCKGAGGGGWGFAPWLR